jgi:hypothetical protein
VGVREEHARLYEVAIDATAHLAAALSILRLAHEKGKQPKLVVASDKMFAQMLNDYQKSLDRARKVLSECKGG